MRTLGPRPDHLARTPAIPLRNACPRRASSAAALALAVEDFLHALEVGLGGGPSNCTGTLSFDMHVLLASGADANLVPGATVSAQYYYRDPQDAQGVGLSDAVLFVVCP